MLEASTLSLQTDLKSGATVAPPKPARPSSPCKPEPAPGVPRVAFFARRLTPSKPVFVRLRILGRRWRPKRHARPFLGFDVWTSFRRWMRLGFASGFGCLRVLGRGRRPVGSTFEVSFLRRMQVGVDPVAGSRRASSGRHRPSPASVGRGAVVGSSSSSSASGLSDGRFEMWRSRFLTELPLVLSLVALYLLAIVL